MFSFCPIKNATYAMKDTTQGMKNVSVEVDLWAEINIQYWQGKHGER